MERHVVRKAGQQLHADEYGPSETAFLFHHGAVFHTDNIGNALQAVHRPDFPHAAGRQVAAVFPRRLGRFQLPLKRFGFLRGFRNPDNLNGTPDRIFADFPHGFPYGSVGSLTQDLLQLPFFPSLWQIRPIHLSDLDQKQV